MHSVVLGLNYKTSPLEFRERTHFEESDVPEVLKRIRKAEIAPESMILATCNRVEIYAVSEEPGRTTPALKKIISQWHNLNLDEVDRYSFSLECESAVEHILSVASGLDSMVLGENQILGQFKRAYELAYEAGATGKYLNKLAQVSIQTGKKVRTDTHIGRGEISVSSVTVTALRRRFATAGRIKVMVLGAGEIAGGIIRLLGKDDQINIILCNRSKEKAREVADQYSKVWVEDWENRYKAASLCEAVVVATSSSDYVLQAEPLSKELNPDASLVLYDLSVPRNVDPSVMQDARVELTVIDDLKNVASENLSKRRMAVDEAFTIVQESRNDFYAWYLKQRILPAFEKLHGHYVDLANEYLNQDQWQLEQWQEDSEEAEAKARKLLLGYIDRLVREPIKNMERIRSLTDAEEMTRVLLASHGIRHISDKDSNASL